VISHNVSMKVDAVLHFKVVNPERAIIQVVFSAGHQDAGAHNIARGARAA
jgi:hypothetical protein